MTLKWRTITLVQGDKLIDLLFIAKDIDGVVMDLTDATVKLKAQAYNFKTDTPITSKVDWDLSGTVTDGPNGKFEVQVPEVDLDPTYDYIAEVEATYPGPRVVTAPLVRLEIIKQLPVS